jgi:ammonia channel protein AmtB
VLTVICFKLGRFGWFSFNAGSTVDFVLHSDQAATAAVNTMLSSGAAAVLSMISVVVR